MQIVSKEQPLFDSGKTALRFALNYHMALPRPQMNKMMADGKVVRIELADGTKITVTAPRPAPRSEQLRGLDGAATAGIVLAHLSRLPDEQQLVLMGFSLDASLPCACRSPCCSGSKVNQNWARVVLRICEHLKEEAELTKVPGKKGLSTHPLMRRMLVEKFFLPKRDLSLVDLARKCEVTEQTVIAHRRPILAYLDRMTDLAWRSIDIILDESRIVGHIG